MNRFKAIQVLRRNWKRIKDPVINGEGNWWQQGCYRILKSPVELMKKTCLMPLIRERALWAMYKSNSLPCESWEATENVKVSSAELVALRAKYEAQLAKVKTTLRVSDYYFNDGPADFSTKRVAVHLHVYYLEVLPKIVSALKAMPCSFDLLVSVPEAVKWCADNEKVIAESLSMLKQIVVRRCPNNGRDIAPFMITFAEDLLKYDYVAHLHTKRSVHMREGEDWLEHTLSHLLGNAPRLSQIFALMDKGSGIVASPNFLSMENDPTGWLHNLPAAQGLLDRAKIALNLKDDFVPIVFPQGNMFWAQTIYLKPLLALGLTYEDFPQEPLPVDGTIAHALERLILVLGRTTGLSATFVHVGAKA